MKPNLSKTAAPQVEQPRKTLNLRERNQQDAQSANGEARGRPKLTTLGICRYIYETHGIIITPRTLSNHAWAGRGPKFYKCGGRRYYDPDHADEWALEELGEPRRSTSDHPKAGALSLSKKMEAPAGGGSGERDRTDARPDGTTPRSHSANCTAIECDTQSIRMARARDGRS
jgi:hypothetical protein